jgi:periplasmic protein TonB
MQSHRLRHPVAVCARSSRLIIQPMHAALEHDDRRSPPTYKFLIALLFSVVSHAVAMTLIDPGVTPAPATAPLRLSIHLTQTPATETNPPAAVTDNQVPRAPEQVPQAVPETKPKPVIKRVKRAQLPRPHPQASSTPTRPQTPAPAPEHPTVAAASQSPATTPAIPAMAVTTVSRKVEYIYNPPPDYPPRARRLGLEGEVLVRTRVLENGECGELVLGQSSGYALLDQAALEAVRTWRFRPARRDDEEIVSWVEIPVRFRLER